MNKTIAIALAATAVLATAAPTMAAPRDLGNGTTDFGAFSAISILKEKGYDATRVENYGDDRVLAFVVDDQGNQVLRFFDNDTLAPVTR